MSLNVIVTREPTRVTLGIGPAESQATPAATDPECELPAMSENAFAFSRNTNPAGILPASLTSVPLTK